MMTDHTTHRDAQVSCAMPANVNWAAVCGAAVEEFARMAGFAGDDVRRISLAFEEAACHAIDLGYGTDNSILQVEMALSTIGVQIAIRLNGLPLDDNSLPQFDPERMCREDDLTGLSSHLIRKMMDKTTFTLRENGEREITMYKSLPRADEVARETAPDPEGREAARRIRTAHAVRMAGPDDAESISRLALRAHGTVFFNEQIYYPARVREMLEQGEMQSVVAETPAGEVIGHAASVKNSPGAIVEELTFLFVDPRFNSQGCTRDIASLMLPAVMERGVWAMRALTVTSHVHAQRSVHEFMSMRECAMLLAASPAAKVWKKTGASAPGRIANMIFVRYLKSIAHSPIYVPERHRAMLERIAEHIGVAFDIVGEAARGLPAGNSLIESVSNFKEGWGLITIECYGADIGAQIVSQLHHFCAEGLAIINLLLPLGDPCTPAVCGECERMNFFFAGIAPVDSGTEALLMQYVNCDADYGSIKVFSPFGKKLLDYVRSCDPSEA